MPAKYAFSFGERNQLNGNPSKMSRNKPALWLSGFPADATETGQTNRRWTEPRRQRSQRPL